MKNLVFVLSLLGLLITASAQKTAPTPAPAPARSSGAKTYSVPNWHDGVVIQNTSLAVGGMLNITWMGMHGVYQTSSYACPDSFPEPNINGLVAQPANGGTFLNTFTKAGQYYFVCQVGNHCSEGQMIAITVS